MKIGGAWIRSTKEGEKFFSCQIEIPIIGKLNFSIFKVKEKKSDKAPDYEIVWNSYNPDKSKDQNQPAGTLEDECPF